MSKVNFSKQKLPPSQLEVDYWIDLTDDPNGGKIKYFQRGQWINLIPDQVLDVSDLKQDILQLNAISNNHELRLQSISITTKNISEQISQLQQLISELTERVTTNEQNIVNIQESVDQEELGEVMIWE